MQGGTVTEVAGVRSQPHVLFVDVAGFSDDGVLETGTVYIERNPTSERIDFGDYVWWKDGTAYWSPRSGDNDPPAVAIAGVDCDVPIPMVTR